jgi:hypothetical protein
MLEEQTAELEAENQADESQEDSNQTDEVVEETEDVQDENVVKQEDLDYEAELLQLQSKLEKKDEIIAHKNRAIESLKRRSGNEDVLEEIANIKERAERELGEIKQSMVSDTIDEEINRVAVNSSEANLIRFHFENSVKLNGYTRSQIRDAVSTAKLKANEKKFNSKLNEMSEALKAKATTDNTRSASSVKIETPEKPKLNAKERDLLRKFGVDA